jgi:microcystin-dependent protein
MFENLDLKDIILGILVIFTIYLIYKTRDLSEHFSAPVSVETQINDFFKSDLTGLRKLGTLINNITTKTDDYTFTSNNVKVNNLKINSIDAFNVDDGIIFNISNASGKQITLNGTNYILGQIVMWSGTIDTIPTGWVLCDGTNGTIDLRGKFILSGISAVSKQSQNTIYNNNTASNGLTIRYNGDQGGESTHSIIIDELPNHTHSLVSGALNIRGGRMSNDGWTSGTHGSFYDGITQTSFNNGVGDNGVPHENMPPYYALFFIQRLKLLNQ